MPVVGTGGRCMQFRGILMNRVLDRLLSQQGSIGSAVIAAFAIGIVVTACGGGGGSKPPTVVEPVDPPAAAANTPLTFEIVDSNGLVEAPMSISFSGADADELLTQVGAAVSSPQSTSSGLLPLSLKAGAMPSEDAPIEFNAVVSGAGYLTTGLVVRIASTETRQIRVVMVKLETDGTGAVAHAPSGVSGAVRDDVSATGGKLNTALTLETPTKDDTGKVVGGATLQIPTTVTLKRADGTPAADGPITASVVSFSAASPEALEAFPGGFAVNVEGAGEGFFVSGGFVAFNLTDSAGQPIKQFSAPVTATITLPAGIVNEDTGEAVKVGDTLPIWSYEEDAGMWAGEGTGTVTAQNADGSFVLSFQTTHLSYWNMDWKGSDTCTASIRVNGLKSGMTVYLSAQFDPANGYLSSGYATFDQPVFPIYLAPRNKRMTITAQSADGTVLGSTTVNNLCAAQVVLNLTPPNQTALAFSTAEACVDKQGNIIASTKRALPSWIYVRGQPQIGTYTYTYGGRTYTYTYTSYGYGGSLYTTGSGASATGTLAVLSSPSTYEAYVYSPRGDMKTVSGITTVQGQTTTVPEVVFPMSCRPVTGTGGGG